jgi:hypothetical protein
VDVNGKIIVSALNGDLNLDSKISSAHPAKHDATSVRTKILAGQKESLDEKCDEKEPAVGTRIPGVGAILNSPWAIGSGAAAITALTCWALCLNGPNPVSPKAPQ